MTNNKGIQILNWVIIIAYYFFLSISCLLFLIGFIFIFIPSSVLTFNVSWDWLPHVQMGLYRLVLEGVDQINFKPIILSTTLGGSVGLFILTLIMYQLKLIFKSLVENDPFVDRNAKRILYIGFLLIIASFIYPAGELLVMHHVLKAINNDTIMFNYSSDEGLFFSGLLVLVLSKVFSYGTYLQNEYNETV